MATTETREKLVLGRYRIAGPVARGAFGRVLRVIDVASGEPRALKLAAREDANVIDEYAQLLRLRHPSLPRVLEIGRTDEAIDDVAAGAPFFIAQWIDGAPCDARASSGAKPLWALLADIAGALAVIHAAGLVHGDVSPSNILVDANGRAILVDLGLAHGIGARGTPTYMAPEAFAGHLEPRSDLYGLGATAIRVATGAPPFAAASLGELVHSIVTASAPPALPGVVAPLSDLIKRLVARELEGRPGSAIAVLDELDQLAPAIAPGALRRARPKVGSPPAPTSWPGAEPTIAALARAIEAGGLHLAVGVAAAGTHQIVEAAVRRWQLAEVARRKQPAAMLTGSIDGRGSHPAGSDAERRRGSIDGRGSHPAGSVAEWRCGSIDGLAAALAVATGPDAARGWVERVARAIRLHPGLVVIELAAEPRAPQLLAALSRGDLRRPVIAIVDRAPAPSEAVHAAVHAVAPLDPAGATELVRAMIGRDPPATWAAELCRISDGHALAAIDLLQSLRAEADPFAIEWSTRTTGALTARPLEQHPAASTGGRALAVAVAAWGGRARSERALATARANAAGEAIGLAEIVELAHAGFGGRRGDDLVIDSATTTAIAEAFAPELAIAATAGLTIALAETAPCEALADLLERTPVDAANAARICDVATELRARGRGDRARPLVGRALAAMPARANLIAARACSAIGAYREVGPFATAAVDAGADPIEARLVVARAAQRAGDLDGAEAELAPIVTAHPDHAEAAGAYARLLVTRSRFADARAVATRGAAPLAGLRAEAAGLAAFYLGDLDDADRAFAALEVGGAAVGDDATVGRALSLRGMVAQQRGQLALASDRYRDAVRRLADVGEIHAAAVAELNLGTTLTERGRASEALPRLAAAGRVFGELGATTEQVAADLNRGDALLAVGQAEDARAAGEAAVAHADGAPHLRAFAQLVLGNARHRLGDTAGAERCYRDALAIGVERGDAHAQASAYIALAEAGHRVTADVATLCASDDDRDRWTLARGRYALRSFDSRRTGEVPALRDSDELGLLSRACADAAGRADVADRLERAFRGHAIAAQLGHRAHDGELARGEAERARSAHAAMVAAAAPAFRAALASDPDLARLPGEPPTAAPRVAQGGDPPLLRRLLALSRRLNSEPNVERILDEVIDTAIELTAAERGFLLLRQHGELAPVVSRNVAAADLETGLAADALSVSRSIAERAAQTGEPVMTVDAGVDERFGAAASVAALRLRSVLAVPLRQRGAVTGCIYVDHRFRGGAFDDAAASVLGELAEIAAIAIENARLNDDLRRSTREVDDLNARLSADLADRDAELARVKADLPDRDRLRHRYERIVGQSPAILRMLGVIDRAAATALPVVVVGESGVGKELVARALHDNGPRSAGPFVAINCSAVPEALLESELFGHVRGAFTGADRDRRGLFEVADGGTLFLDEIADTAAAMQAKLLRVLQDGVIRRVGDSTTRKVDVRVIAASQRSLAELSAAGRFREDLRFRLEVITVPVPALRDRDGDVPFLVDAVLAQLCANKKPPRLTRAAQRALAQHRWPGNVRELENALARGVAMGGDVIDVADLPEAIAAAAARPEPAKPQLGEDLRLKPALNATEHAYIAAAMTRANGNQTVASRLLGLSRFGLQKKLRRLAGDDGGGDDE